MATLFSIHTVLAEQTERTRGSSAAQIKELIADSDSKVESLQNQIAALESRVAALVELRDRERANGDALRFLTAPIRTLPVELLAEIFLLTIRESDANVTRYSWEAEGYSSHIQDAYRVSHVCRRWRQVANSTPRLWTGSIKVDFRLPFYEEDIDEFDIDGLEMWLPRSAPLSIPITLRGVMSQSCLSESGSRLINALLCIAPRWRSLRFERSPAPGAFVQRLTDSRLDSLEELVLSTDNYSSSQPTFDCTALPSFMAASRLRKVTLKSSYGLPMPWAQLTHITLEDILSPQTFRNIFSQCTNVVQVSIYIEWSELSPDALAFNQLRALSVTLVGDENGMQFFHCLSAPALDNLVLYLEDSDIEWAEATFTAFQLRSPNITQLKIDGDGIFIPPHALITALRHAASLTHLSIDECPNSVDDHFCQALCYAEDAEPLVPRLHTLAVADSNGDFSQEGLANMIASRWWTDGELASRARAPAVARWRRIRFKDPSSDYIPAFQEKMKALQETGLDVDFVEVERWSLDW